LKIENIQKFKGKINGILIEEEQLFTTVQFVSALFEMKFRETTKKETKIIINFAEEKYYGNGFSWEKIEETAEDIFDNSEKPEEFIKKLKKSNC
jgi:hypothetical protein